MLADKERRFQKTHTRLGRALYDHNKGRRLIGDVLSDGGVEPPLLLLSLPRALALGAPSGSENESLRVVQIRKVF